MAAIGSNYGQELRGMIGEDVEIDMEVICYR